MPCRYYTDAEERQMALDEACESIEKIEEMQRELDLLTRVACNLAGFVPTIKTFNLTEETIQWLKDHARKDFVRSLKEREEKRTQLSSASNPRVSITQKEEGISPKNYSRKSSEKKKGKKRSTKTSTVNGRVSRDKDPSFT